MLLERLCAYADRLEGTGPPMYDRTRIKYLIDLDRDGCRGTLVTLTGDEGTRNDRGVEMFAPTLVRSSGIRAKLLADNGEYVLGWGREGSNPRQVTARHAAFVERVRDCAAVTGHPGVCAVLRFLEADGPATLERPDDFDPSANITFRVDGHLPIDDDTVRAYWARVTAPGDAGDGGAAQCLVCGRTGPVVERLQFKIKGIPGGQSSGTALISANEEAFSSYGLSASRVSPICGSCAERFSKALNALLANESTRLYLAGLVYAFWTRDDVGFSPVGLLSQPDEGQVRALLDAARRGQSAAVALDPSPFYAVALAGSGGRVAVRDWIDTTVGSAKQNLARYFALQALVRPDGSPPRPYGLAALVGATQREGSRDPAPPTVPRALLRVALAGGPLPRWLLAQVLRRIRAAQRVTPAQATVIKMVLLSQRGGTGEEGTLMELDPNQRHPAYLCGRLLAVLDAIQRAALGSTNATIIDRFFGTASTAPASVFGRLVRGAQPHLGKLRRERPGAYAALERRLEEIMRGLPTFPRTLTIDEQGLFVLGYYHQRADDARARLEHRRQETEAVTDGAEQPAE
ncbi:MAG: type I-C CRISPR-associated protein Cas8c/Csd1 [Sphaerobacter sp.]|nr:type I-C CRISPR-associated protein Cas8c/Csd1 [Sphaerobacter sp.]